MRYKVLHLFVVRIRLIIRLLLDYTFDYTWRMRAPMIDCMPLCRRDYRDHRAIASTSSAYGCRRTLR